MGKDPYVFTHPTSEIGFIRILEYYLDSIHEVIKIPSFEYPYRRFLALPGPWSLPLPTILTSL